MSTTDLERMWVAKHILTSVLASYLVLRGITLLFFEDYYPKDIIQTEK
jgi:hypothetical protein